MSDPRLTDEAIIQLHARIAATKTEGTFGEMPVNERWVYTTEFEEALPDVAPHVLAIVLRDMRERGVIYGCPCGCRGDWHTKPWTFADWVRRVELPSKTDVS